ncbi:MAG: LuxR C-terminal-related transcriptional regulator [Actinomycetota bacterium]|nr:LuxR C-terminal-related transcriptional regulator [Actinomycetota bacterium]
MAEADWDAARSCFEQARELGESAEALDGLSRALHFQGEYTRAIELTERAFAAYRQLDKPVEAADRARWLAFLHGTINSNMAVASGWMARAETLLAGEDECAGHGWLALDRAPFTDDAADRQRLAAAALALARRFGDVDLEYDALALLGESYVASGRVAEGMQLIDEAMTAVSAGEVTAIVPVGDICCRLLSACEMALDITRAEQWMSLAGGYEAWSDFVSPVCRSHYGGILVAVGRWGDAEEELLAAIRTFENSYRAMRGSPLVKLADLRVRQGRLDEARRLLEGHESHPIARRTLATIALACSDVALAEELIRLCLDGTGASDPACAPALELLVQIRLARDDVRGATQALERLTDLASSCGDDCAAGFAELARGRVRAAEGDERASTHLQAALRGFSGLGLPLEGARAQLELATAIAQHAPEAAIAEARLAVRTFERIGATGDADRAAGLLRRLGTGGRTWPRHYGTLTKRETEVLSLLADGCSNAVIAERLYISRRTAEHHVARVLSKLGLRSRAEAAAYAVRDLPKDS